MGRAGKKGMVTGGEAELVCESWMVNSRQGGVKDGDSSHLRFDPSTYTSEGQASTLDSSRTASSP